MGSTPAVGPRVTARRWWDAVAVPPSTVVPLAAGVLLQRVRPVDRRWPARHVGTGLTLVAAGVAVNGWASVTRRGHVDRPERLTTTGPYAVSRHPMYVGWHLVHLGAVLASRSTWSGLGLAVALALTHRVVLAEERALGARFGAGYDTYRDRVPRYL